MRWSQLQPLLVVEGRDDLLQLTEAGSTAGAEAAAHCRTLLTQSPGMLDPPPLLTGDDLLAAGIPCGPRFKTLLQRVRAAQLDGQLCTKGEALERVKEWAGE
jgi:poly(A) polymerase